MVAKGLTSKCQTILEEGTHVCFGISPFNSYFSKDCIEKLARWGRSNFKTISFFVPDVPAAYTLEAMGYSRSQAASKARQQANYTWNKIMRALTEMRIPYPDAWEMIVGWKHLSNNNHFLTLYQQVEELFSKDPTFKEECLLASRWVLEKKMSSAEMSPEVLQSAARYFLAELPMFVNSASILGKESSVFCYHNSIPFLERLFSNALPIKPATNQAFAVISENQSRPELPFCSGNLLP